MTRSLRGIVAVLAVVVATATVLSGTVGASPPASVPPASIASASIAPAPPGTLPPAANGTICYYGACYDYVYGRQRVDASGASVVMYQVRPELDRADVDGHSLQELAVQSADGSQIVEVGWTVDRGLNGDAHPHLFVYHWVSGQESCYNGCGFVPTSRIVKAGMRLREDSAGVFSIENRDGDWWISYDGLPVGYFPGSLWDGAFTRLGLVQTFGEVAAKAAPSCTDMGDGDPGPSPRSSWIAGFRLYDASTHPSLEVLSSSPDWYRQGLVHATSFHLGGPGSGRCA